MKQKVLLLFAMLSLSVTGAWAWSYQQDDLFDTKNSDSKWYRGDKNHSGYQTVDIPNTNYEDKIYEDDYFQLYQYGGEGATLDKDGWTAPYGIKFSGLNGQWIKSVLVTEKYSLADRQWDETDLTVTGGTIENYKEENNKISFTIVVQSASEFTFSTNGKTQPHFNFVINYIASEPYLLNTRTQLETLVSGSAGQQKLVYHTRDFKENVATTICLPFAVEADETGEFADGLFYELTTVTFDEQKNEWVAAMTQVSTDIDTEDGTYTQANKPYLFLPLSTKKISFTGTINKVPSSVPNAVAVVGETTAIDNETSRKWYMQGTYDRVNFTDLNSGDSPLENVYGFVSAFNTDGDGNGTAIDFTNESVYAGEFVRAAGNAYFPIFRAYLSYLDSKLQPQISDQNPQARRDTRSNASAPSRIAVRLINNDGSVTKLDNVEIPVVSNVWYDLQGRRYNSKPAKAGIYMNNGKKMIVK